MRLIHIILMATIFFAGAVAGNTYASTHAAFTNPTNLGGYELPVQLYSTLTGAAIPRPIPNDHVTEEQIKVYKDRVVLDIPDAIFARFTPTRSMEPVLSHEANALEIVPTSENQVREGDVVAYQNSCTGEGVVIHRVIVKGEDQLGAYFLTKGDNNPSADPCKVRFDEIKSVVVAIIY